MTAKDRITALRNTQADILCSSAETALSAFVDIMNKETTLLRAGDFRTASELSAEKGQMAQDYVALARAVQDQALRLKDEAPAELARLQAGHEKLATQMAENLRVLATSKSITQDLIGDVARATGRQSQPNTYGQTGQMSSQTAQMTKGLAIDAAL